MPTDNTGYHDCPCRDCFEIAIGTDANGQPSLCHECQRAGCDGDGECCAPHAYGGMCGNRDCCNPTKTTEQEGK